MKSILNFIFIIIFFGIISTPVSAQIIQSYTTDATTEKPELGSLKDLIVIEYTKKQTHEKIISITATTISTEAPKSSLILERSLTNKPEEISVVESDSGKLFTSFEEFEKYIKTNKISLERVRE